MVLQVNFKVFIGFLFVGGFYLLLSTKEPFHCSEYFRHSAGKLSILFHFHFMVSLPDLLAGFSQSVGSHPFGLINCRLSPHCTRRLSTLVEEGSDVESEDHLHHHSAKSRLSTTYEMPYRQGQSGDLDIPAGPPPPYRPRTPPNYRCPPAYQQAVHREASR